MTRRLPPITVVAEVVEQVVSLLTAMTPAPALYPDFSGGELRVVSVTLRGGVDGVVSLTCGERFARQVAAAMLGSPAADVGEEAIRDALGELVQIIAGNLKSLVRLPEGCSCQLSQPAVTTKIVSYPSARYRTRLGFACGGESFGLTLWEFDTERSGGSRDMAS